MSLEHPAPTVNSTATGRCERCGIDFPSIEALAAHAAQHATGQLVRADEMLGDGSARIRRAAGHIFDHDDRCVKHDRPAVECALVLGTEVERLRSDCRRLRHVVQQARARNTTSVDGWWDDWNRGATKALEETRP